MKLQTLVTVVLFAFVLVCAVYLLVEATNPPVADPPGAIPATAAPVLPDQVLPTTQRPAHPVHQVIAYYFHRTQRCATCLAIERQAHEALTEAFATELADGALAWRPVNLDESVNTHFVKSYAILGSALVLVDLRDGAEQSWVNLEQVWELVHDEPAFKHYVTQQTHALLER